MSVFLRRRRRTRVILGREEDRGHPRARLSFGRICESATDQQAAPSLHSVCTGSTQAVQRVLAAALHLGDLSRRGLGRRAEILNFRGELRPPSRRSKACTATMTFSSAATSSCSAIAPDRRPQSPPGGRPTVFLRAC